MEKELIKPAPPEILFEIDIAKPKKNYSRGFVHPKQVLENENGKETVDHRRCTDENGKELTFSFPFRETTTYGHIAWRILAMNGFSYNDKMVFNNCHVFRDLFKLIQVMIMIQEYWMLCHLKKYQNLNQNEKAHNQKHRASI